RTASGWVSAPTLAGAQNSDLEVHSGMLLASTILGTCADAELIQKQSGTWTTTQNFPSMVPPGPTECDVDSSGGDVDLTNNRVIVGQAFNAASEVQIWNRDVGGTWPSAPTAVVQLPPEEPGSGLAGRSVTIEGDTAIASANSRLVGPYVLRQNGTWSVAGNLLRPDRATLASPSGLELLNGIAAIGYGTGAPLVEPSVGIFTRNASGDFEYVARLIPSDGLIFDNPEISGRRVVASGVDADERVVYVFDLPASFTQPALIQDDFEDRNTAEWTHIPGSVVSVPFNGLSSFYRQSRVAGDAGSFRTGFDMTDQSIEADVVARSYAAGSGDRWFGLAVRQTDPGNLYYLTLRNSNVISLRKRVNGVVTVLASRSEFVDLNRRYKLRLEAIGSRVRAYVDGQLVLEAVDRSLTRGTPGLRMYRTATDYDNVVISPNPQTALLLDNFDIGGHEPWWIPRSGSWVELAEGFPSFNRVFMQGNTTGARRADTDIDVDDQVVQVRARATAFRPGDDRWFGIFARLQDDQNHYFLTVRSSNSVSLRKRVNGTVIVLDTASFPVSVGTWYTLRLEAVGSSLRGYVNNQPLVEAIDNDFAEGSWGLGTLSAAAQFDDVRVTQP
ncbi:MAG TPA: hypothetical protein VLD59_00095, partial [Steroidobacteraceae bacterium]|nr:hypothetical protein [Steroidobacteraceae bacterium]